MIGKVFQFFHTLVLLAAIIGFGFVTYKGYQLYRGVADRMDQIGQWIDRFSNQEKRWARCEERVEEIVATIRKWKTSDEMVVRRDGKLHTLKPPCKNDDCMCDIAYPLSVCDCNPCTCGTKKRTTEDVIKEADPTPVPIDQTVIQKPLKPTVIMQSMQGCGPCEDWWRNNASRWEAAGWIVKRENGTDAGPFPWFRVWDGEKWLTVRDRLTLESYKRAGGK